MGTDLSKKKLAKAVTVYTDENGKITKTVAILQNGSRIEVAGPLDLRVQE